MFCPHCSSVATFVVAVTSSLPDLQTPVWVIDWSDSLFEAMLLTGTTAFFLASLSLPLVSVSVSVSVSVFSEPFLSVSLRSSKLPSFLALLELPAEIPLLSLIPLSLSPLRLLLTLDTSPLFSPTLGASEVLGLGSALGLVAPDCALGLCNFSSNAISHSPFWKATGTEFENRHT